MERVERYLTADEGDDLARRMAAARAWRKSWGPVLWISVGLAAFLGVFVLVVVLLGS